MSSIGIVINIYIDKESVTSLHKCNNVVECKTIIIEKIGEILNTENFDFPVCYEEFKSSWMQTFGTEDAYTFYIFMEGEWIDLWSEEELYSDIYDYMLSIQKPLLNANGTLNEYDIESDNDDLYEYMTKLDKMSINESKSSSSNEKNINNDMEY